MNAFKNITTDEWKELRNEKKGKVVDVRTKQEFEGGHLPDAENIDVQEPDFYDKIDSLDKEDTYYVYCRSGGRSAMAMNIMKTMDFKEVYNLDGGIVNWFEKGNEIEEG